MPEQAPSKAARRGLEVTPRAEASLPGGSAAHTGRVSVKANSHRSTNFRGASTRSGALWRRNTL